MRLLILRTIIVFWLLAVASPPSARAQNSTTRPNVVLILIDDLRYDTFGYMGHPFVETPNIDFLANNGMQFTRAFVTTSLCSPSRASFLSGRYMHNHRVVDNADPMPEGTVTFPQLLQDSGYRTAFIGKWHMGGSSDAPRDGFDHWVSFPGQGTYAPGNFRLNVDGERVPRRKYMTDELTDYATDWLERQTAAQPFLLYLSHKGVHGLYEPAPRHLDRYRNAKVPLPTPIASNVEQSGKPMWVHDQHNSWHGVEFPYYGRAKQSLEEMYRHYCEMVLSIDDSVGEVLRTLRSRGLNDNTLVIFTSDGGHLWGEHGLIDKRCAYEESIRIPLLLYGTSRIKPSSKSNALVANIDVAPSILEMAGVKTPTWMDGRSFVELITNPGDTESWRRALLYEYYWEPQFPQTPTTFCLRGDRFKLIQYHGIWDTDEFYDLQNDPRETENLIRDPNHQQRVSQMRRQLYDQLKETNGLAIFLGKKRGEGSNARKRGGSERAEFPSYLLRDSP
jgi:N-acetylglucosamine-6-sulfatase